MASVTAAIVSHVTAICVSKPAYGVASDIPRHSLHYQSKELRSRVDINLVNSEVGFHETELIKVELPPKKIEVLHLLFFWIALRSLSKRF